MDQGRYGEAQRSQGKFAEEQAQETWVCPECETINTGNTCILCGYKKENWNTIQTNKSQPESKKKNWKGNTICIAVAAAILAVVVLVGFFVTKPGNETASPGINTAETSISMQEEIADVPMYKPVENQTYAPDAWKDNVMKRSPDSKFVGVVRDEICSVSFLDTVTEAPKHAWDVSEAQNGSVLAWTEKNGEYYDLYIAGDGGVNAVNACQELFARYFNLIEINFNNCFHTEQVTDMSRMFQACRKLSSLDLSNMDTSNVTKMSHMFANCSSLKYLDVSRLDTSNVTDMMSMFSVCSSLTSLDVSTFDTSNVTNMSYMFNDCHSLSSLNVSGMDTQNVIDMSSMFNDCGNLISLDVGGFETSKVMNMNSMFKRCKKLKSVNVSEFDTTYVTDMCYMFWGCDDLKTLDISKWETTGTPYCFMDEGKYFNGRPWEELFE